jgi:hypothetical protein
VSISGETDNTPDADPPEVGVAGVGVAGVCFAGVGVAGVGVAGVGVAGVGVAEAIGGDQAVANRTPNPRATTATGIE